jgi:hypothetical protein
MPEALHVANGHCTTRLIEQALLAPQRAESARWGPRWSGRTQVWCDPLHEGPIADVPDAEFLRVRAADLALGLGRPVDEVEADLKSWRAAVDADHAYDELVLWYEHDLFDQLNLIQLLARVGRDRPIRKPVSLISIDSYPGHPNFRGLGELAPEDIAKLYGERRRVTPAQFALAARAWDAFRSQDRARMESLLLEDTTALPFLGRALRRYLDEAPDEPGGLTRSERRLLDQLAAGPVDIHTAWKRMHEGESAFYITDTSFWSLLKGLAERTPALIDIALDSVAAAGLPQGTLSLRS